MLKIWKEATDNIQAFGALWAELSKVFDCLSHDLLITKLHAYGLDIDSLNILGYCLSSRKQITKVNSFYSFCEALLSGVTQASILALLLFNMFICEMLLILKTTYFTGHAGNKTPFVVRDNRTDVIKDLEEKKKTL